MQWNHSFSVLAFHYPLVTILLVLEINSHLVIYFLRADIYSSLV